MPYFALPALRIAAVLLAVAASSAGNAGAATVAAPALGKPHFTLYVSGQAPGFSAGKSPIGIVAGPDGNVWFTEIAGGGASPGIAKITPAGQVTEYPTGTSTSSRPIAIVAGFDKNLWFTDVNAAAIGRITPRGHITLFKTGLSAGEVPVGLTRGNDGFLWFVSQGQAPYIGKIDMRGNIVEVARLEVALTADPALAQDTHGNVWLTANNGSNAVLARIDPAGRLTTRGLPLQPGLNPCCVDETPQGFTTRGDGSVWFTNLFYSSPRGGNHPLGVVAANGVHLVFNSLPFIGSVARDAGNGLWLANQDPFFASASIAIMYPKGSLQVFPLPHGVSPLSITVAPNGAVWTTAIDGNAGAGAVVRATF